MSFLKLQLALYRTINRIKAEGIDHSYKAGYVNGLIHAHHAMTNKRGNPEFVEVPGLDRPLSPVDVTLTQKRIAVIKKARELMTYLGEGQAETAEVAKLHAELAEVLLNHDIFVEDVRNKHQAKSFKKEVKQEVQDGNGK